MLNRQSLKRFLHLENFFAMLCVICYFKLKRENSTLTEMRESEEVPQWLQFAYEDTQNLTGDLTIFHIINISLPTSVSIDTQK